jgi:hypothetical protein
MTAFRVADVRAALAPHGVDVGPQPVLLNEDDQRFTILDKGGAGWREWRDRGALAFGDRNNGAQAFAEHMLKMQPAMCYVRAFTPRVSENSTSWLTRPPWPTFPNPPSAKRARADRLAAYADASDDNATEEALTVRRSLVGRARILLALCLRGEEGRVLLSSRLPSGFINDVQAELVAQELTPLCALWEEIERMRARSEIRTRQLGRSCDNPWHAAPSYVDWYMFAAVDYHRLAEYLYGAVPLYEALQYESESDEEDHGEMWPTMRRCDPVMHDAPSGEECSICLGGNEDCEVGTLECGHTFGKSCLMRWLNELDSQDLPRTCPMCRRLPYNSESKVCHGCGMNGFAVQLHTLGGPCKCAAVFCNDCAPSRDYACDSCRMCYQ